MSRPRDPYQLLGVTRRSSPAEMQRAFRRLALKWHPDRQPERADCGQRFREIVDAYRRIRRWQRDNIAGAARDSAAPLPAWVHARSRQIVVAPRWPVRLRRRVQMVVRRYGVVISLLCSAGTATAITAVGLKEPAAANAPAASVSHADRMSIARSEAERETLILAPRRSARRSSVDGS